MKLSTKGKYGLRAVIDLADYGDVNPVPITDIASRQGISASYLEQLLPKLRKAGIIKSERGATGGYQLAKNAKDISVGDILMAIGENLDIVACVSEFYDYPHDTPVTGFCEDGNKGDSKSAGEGDICSSSGNCVAKLVWKRINDSIYDAVNSIMLDELVAISRSNHIK